MKTLLLSMEDVQKLLSMKDIIDAVKEGYLAFEQGKVQQPDIVSMEMADYNGETDIKSCYSGLNQRISVKIASGFYNNGIQNTLPTMIGMIQIFDGCNGAPLCIMDGSLITNIRTGAAGAVSAEYLARKNAKTVCVIGGGNQAKMQVYGLCCVRPIEMIKVFSQYPAELPRYKEEVERETGVPVRICATIEEAMEGADIAISTTPTKQFIVPAGAVPKGIHIVAVGADMPGKNEWDPEVFRGAKIVNDSIKQCAARGETRNALRAGTITPSDIYGEIGELVAGKKTGRINEDEITIFDTTGMAIQDNVTAVKIYELALQKQVGSWFEFLKGEG